MLPPLLPCSCRPSQKGCSVGFNKSGLRAVCRATGGSRVSLPFLFFSIKTLAFPIRSVLFISNITTVKGLELFGVKLSDASKKLGKKFATGASVVKNSMNLNAIDEI